MPSGQPIPKKGGNDNMVRDYKILDGDMFSWSNSIEYLGKEYYYHGNFTSRSVKKEIARLTSEGYEVKVIRPRDGLGLVHLIYTYPETKP